MSPSRILAILGAVALCLAVASDVLISRSSAFWESVRAHAIGPGEERLQLEARLRTRAPRETELLVLGNSIVQTNVSRRVLPAGLGLPPRSIEYLWLPAADALEIAMLTPELIDLEPRAVVYLATVWALYGPVDFDQVRVYDAGFALRLFGGETFLEQRRMHARGLLESHHVVLRQRDPLRRMLLRNVMRDPGIISPDEHAERFRQIREAAVREDFFCDNVQMRAIRQMVTELRAAGVSVLVAGTPVRHRFARDPELQRELDRCLGALVDRAGGSYLPLANLPAFEERDFVDDMHMNGSGQRKFSERLLDPLARVLLD